ncbi:DUF5030 domain-containing protein [Bacteroides sp. 1001136B_160425_E2]|uniref:DUF5030 domain-containing protein n=1 Tax=Bacteroides sp. 1001136B_160425_E2 TaxID=2787083 RepID=UPI0018A01144|nr:DUF5030 domain-containing protein [Bacteroides sp. 1001136B_160425_E2]
MRINSLFFIFLLLCLRIYSQNREFVCSDTISVKEMIENFQERKNVKSPIEFYDYICGVSETNMTRLVMSPFKIGHCDIAMDNCHAVWELFHSQLILKSILPIGITEKEANQLFSMLVEKYGGNHEEGILASWFTGSLDILDCPYELFGEWVSKEKTTLIIQKGHIVSQKSFCIPERTISHDKKKIFINDGCWEQNLTDISCLEVFVNKNIESTYTLFKKSYSLLLFTDLSGRSSIYVLEPEKLSWLDERIIKRLKAAIQLLPVRSFGYLETLSGRRFQGRYLNATYTYREGWMLKDYIH